jgi:regulator of CtrA degradation
LTKETLRLTSRLTQVMAWLMAQRALQDGEIGEDEFVEDKYRLEGHEICLKRAFEDLEDLPEGLNDLMSRSYDLYSRVMRLDEQYADPKKRN